MNITISGTPGSGKSAIAAELARRGYKTVGVVRMQSSPTTAVLTRSTTEH